MFKVLWPLPQIHGWFGSLTEMIPCTSLLQPKGILKKRAQGKTEEKRVKLQTKDNYVIWTCFYEDCGVLESFGYSIKNNMAGQKDEHVDKLHN